MHPFCGIREHSLKWVFSVSVSAAVVIKAPCRGWLSKAKIHPLEVYDGLESRTEISGWGLFWGLQRNILLIVTVVVNDPWTFFSLSTQLPVCLCYPCHMASTLTCYSYTYWIRAHTVPIGPCLLSVPRTIFSLLPCPQLQRHRLQVTARYFLPSLERAGVDKSVGAPGCSWSPPLCWCALELVFRRPPFGLFAAIFRMALYQRAERKVLVMQGWLYQAQYIFSIFIPSAFSFIISQLVTENQDE